MSPSHSSLVERGDVVHEVDNITEERESLDVYIIRQLGGENKHGIGFRHSA